MSMYDFMPLRAHVLKSLLTLQKRDLFLFDYMKEAGRLSPDAICDLEHEDFEKIIIQTIVNCSYGIALKGNNDCLSDLLVAVKQAFGTGVKSRKEAEKDFLRND